MKVPDELASANLNQRDVEDWVIGFWDSNDIYHKVKQASRSRKRKLYFLDGPPYASAQSIHLGTAWNKVLKDSLIRHYRMRGFDVWDQPGFDTHGLPIEVMVERKIGVKNKHDIENAIGIENFINSCLELVKNNIKGMAESFKQLGIFMDWENPYLTYTDDYIESGWYLIKEAFKKGLLYHGGKVLHWCPRCETTLADYEVSEYVDLEDPSIYVKFHVKGDPKRSLLIWTTTPWTLPANAFVIAHPDLEYAEVEVNGEVLIMLASRVEAVMKEVGVSGYKVLRIFKGRELENLEYEHPLEDLVTAQRELSKYHKVVMAPEAINPNEGTGLVHAAPGHGDIDFEVGQRLGVPPLSLLGNDGRMTEEAGKYAGLYFRGEANEAIVSDLRERGALFYATKVVHRYPVCWRCKTPLALRLTDQWFIAVSKLKDKLAKGVDSVEWVPAWAKSRIAGLISQIQDWVISRQRYWGIPLPIWVCTKCGHIEVIGSVEELERLGGRRPPNLHRPWIDRVTLRCPVCGGEMRRVPDVADVWFDSGIAFYASLGYPKGTELFSRLMPVDLVLEGHDQLRGWFFSMLRSGIIGFDSVPYRRVLVHGFVLDEQGREMHKSLGNYVAPEEVLAKYSRDVLRLYLLRNTVWEDLKFSWRNVELTARDFTIIRNVFAFASLYMSLDGFDPKLVSYESVKDYLQPEDRWLLSRVNSALREYRKAFDMLQVHEAAALVRNLIVEDVSRWYLRLIRRRVWVEENNPSKMAAYYTLYYALRTWIFMAAPIIPFTAEYLYQKFVRPAEPEMPESVHVALIPEPDESLIDEDLEGRMIIIKEIAGAALSARMKAGIKLRRPLRRAIVAFFDPKVSEAVKELRHVLEAAVNVHYVELMSPEAAENMRTYEVEPIMGEIGRDFKKMAPAVALAVKSEGARVARELLKNGQVKIRVGDAEIVLEPRHVKVKVIYPEWLSAVESKYGLVGVDIKVSEEEELEGLAREVIRRVQFMRKEMGLKVEAYIDLWLYGDEDLIKSVKAKESYVKSETRSRTITFGLPPSDALVREWEVEERRLTIGVRQANGKQS